MSADSLLVIFVKNPELGKVKTRLAKTIGEQAALEIYMKLLRHTHRITKNIPQKKEVHFSGFIGLEGLFSDKKFKKKLQIQGNLGIKMQTAFEKAFKAGYEKVVLIGSDCYELSESILHNAFEALDEYDVVLGPAKDGGYYLIGMKEPSPQLFYDKKWSTDSVLEDTKNDCYLLELDFFLLEELNDVDREEDLPEALKPLAKKESTT